MKLLQALTEASDATKLQKIADMIYDVCEGEVADTAANEGGTNFTGDAIDNKCEQVCTAIKALVKERIKKENQ